MTPKITAAICGLLALGTVPGETGALDWVVVSVNGAAADPGGTVSFKPDGSFSAFSGCNRYNGSASFDGAALTVAGPVAATKLACPGDALSRQDDAFAALFEGKIGVAFDPLRSTLSLVGSVARIELVPAFPEDAALPATHGGLEPPTGEPPYLAAFGIAGQLDIHAEASAGTPVVGRVDPGTVLRSGGCAEVGGTSWCKVSLADGSQSGWATGDVLEPADSALRAGQGVFDAAGLVPCAKGIGAPTAPCAFGVARDGGGTATVVVNRPDCLTRAIFFTEGALLGADTSEADGGHDVSVVKEGDLALIRVNDERYEIPDAVIRGG